MKHLIRQDDKKESWHEWYAWRPVIVRDSFHRKYWVWLTVVERIAEWQLWLGDGLVRCWKYRFKKE